MAITRSSQGILRAFLMRLTPTIHSRNASTNVMKTLLESEPNDNVQLTVKGWVQSVRQHKEIAFLHLRDGSSFTPLQIVLPSSVVNSDVTYGSCVEVTGFLQESAGKGQRVELDAKTLSVIGKCDPLMYPFKARKHHPSDYVRQFLHLRPRTVTFSALLRIRNAVTQAMHAFFQENNFCQIHTPIITSNDCEGAGEIFQVEPSTEAYRNASAEDAALMKNFFNTPAYLTVSGQLHLEAFMGSFSRVYTFSPTFRAENSRSRHHLSEFHMVEAEVAFTEHVEDLNKISAKFKNTRFKTIKEMIVENLVKFTTKRVLDSHEEDVAWFMKNVADKSHKDSLNNLVNKDYHRLSYTEAINILEPRNKKFDTPVQWGSDLQKEHERYLVEHCGNVPVFVMDYPTELKPFYARVNDTPETVAAADLLCADVGEVCGGSLREERLDILEDRLTRLGLAKRYDWYLDLRRFGSAPHGGFGIGFERYLQMLLGISNIKDTIPFPRFTHNCKM